MLKAASFGKTVVDLPDGDSFVNVCEVIRALNAVRHYEVGLPLSYEQFERLNPERLVQRLVNRRDYLLALRISDCLKVPSDRVYAHWASQKVRASTEDEAAICKSVVDRVHNHPGVSFEFIARAAYDEGRSYLATKLLNHELRAGKQVLLLLDMEEDTLALDKAIESGDTDLVLYVLLQLRAKLPLATFFRTINTRAVAVALVEATARDQDRDLLKDLFYQDDRRLDGANLLFIDALTQLDSQHKLDKLRSATQLLKDSKEHSAQARLIEETGKLLRVQDSLEADTKLFADSFQQQNTVAASDDESGAATRARGRPKFHGLSLNATLHTLILHTAHKRASQLASDFAVSPRTFAHIRLRALVGSRNWTELEHVAKTTKRAPPFGWEPFAKEIMGAGNKRLAGNTFVPLCKGLSPKERAELYVQCRMWKKAAEEVLKGKSAQTEVEWVRELLEKIPPGEVGERRDIERLLAGSASK